MRDNFKKLGEKGITLVILIFVILLLVAIIGFIIKEIFDFKTMGATTEKEWINEDAVRKICKLYSR